MYFQPEDLHTTTQDEHTPPHETAGDSTIESNPEDGGASPTHTFPVDEPSKNLGPAVKTDFGMETLLKNQENNIL